MRRKRKRYDGVLSSKYPSIEQLEKAIDIDPVDADLILGSDPHFQRSLREWINKGNNDFFFYDLT